MQSLPMLQHGLGVPKTSKEKLDCCRPSRGYQVLEQSAGTNANFEKESVDDYRPLWGVQTQIHKH